MKARLLDLAQRLWDACPQPVRRTVLHATNDKFMVGVCGLIYDDDHRVLLLEHRFRTPWRWGLPGGFMERGEDLVQTVKRELMEEIGVEVHVDPTPFDTELVRGGGYLSITMLGRPGFDPRDLGDLGAGAEIVGGGFYGPEDLPEETYPYQKALLRRFWTDHRLKR